MCGISGIISLGGKSLDVDVVKKFEKSSLLMSHRGPDYFDTYKDEKVALFHHRLSIIDLDSRANQPYHAPSGQYLTVFNGEIYNYLELKDQYKLNTQTESDTEVMIQTFEQDGFSAIAKWNGIFAICIYDKLDQRISLIRDRFGVKPLYVFEDNDYLAFSSEAKVLFNWLPSLSLNHQALAEYMWQGNTISSQTLVNEVKKFDSATMMSYDLKRNKSEKFVFWKNPGTSSNTPSEHEAIAKTKELLRNAVKSQLHADVPLGVFLSGGIDSSAITAFAAESTEKRLNTYSVEFDFNQGGVSELKRAALVSKRYGTIHNELKVESKNISNLIEKLVFQHDEPFADAANIPLFLLTEQIQGNIKVVLQGDGGDELFAGYNRYDLISRKNRWTTLGFFARFLSPTELIRHRADRIYKALTQKEDYQKMALLTMASRSTEQPWRMFQPEIRRKLDMLNPFDSYKACDTLYQSEDLVQRMLYTDVMLEMQHTFLEKVDKSTMLNSVEARVPFLDNELSEFIMALPSKLKVKGGEKKYLLKKALRGIVPDEILDSPKRGFGVPVDTWLRTTLLDQLQSALDDGIRMGYLQADITKRILLEHLKCTANHGHLLWKLMVLFIWLRRYQDKLGFKQS